MTNREPESLSAGSTLPPETRPPLGKRRRWLVPLTMLVVGTLAGWLAWQADDVLFVARLLGLCLWMFTGLLLVGWFVLFSGWPTRRRVALAGVIGLGLLVFLALFRIEQFEGDMVPQLAYRWSPTAEQRVAEYRQALADDEPVGLADLINGQPTDYPGFLGANRRGWIDAVRLDPDWQSHPPELLWRHPVGLGWSSFAVVGDFAVTQELLDGKHAVVCYDIATGRPVWTHTGAEGFLDPTHMGGNGPRATPTIHQGRVYALAGGGELVCLDGANGQVLWQRNILADTDAPNISWGMSGSPLVYGQVVVVAPGGNTQGGERHGHDPNGQGALVAYDLLSGDIVWQADTAERASYSSPFLTRIGGVDQVLCLTGPGLSAFDPHSGQRLWHFPWITNGNEMINIAQPLVLADWGFEPDDARVFLSTGYGKGCAMIEVGQGDDDTWRVTELWSNNHLDSKMSNLVIRDGAVFGLHERIFVGLDLADGQRLWRKRTDIGYGQLLRVGSLLLAQTEPGAVELWQVDRNDAQRLATLPALDDKSWNHPVLSGNRLLVRNDREAACYRVKLKE